MSAYFIIRFRGFPVKLTYRAGKRIYETVERAAATTFLSEADAWLAVRQYELPLQHTEVSTRDAVVEARAAC